MTTPLYMVKLTPDLRRLSAWAGTHGLLRAGGDLGYAIHAALLAAFADRAPKPFRLHENGSASVLYAYAAAAGAELLDHARAFADPEVATALGLDSLAVKAMPGSWQSGRRLGFEVRVRPVVRRDRGGDRDKACERDAFQLAFDAAEAAASAGGARLVPPRRDAVYAAWLGAQLASQGSVRLIEDSVKLVSFQRLRVARRGRAGADGRRRLHESEGPDAVLSGVLELTDGDSFAALLSRGIGRHRAFGFGMLLLRPPRTGAPSC